MKVVTDMDTLRISVHHCGDGQYRAVLCCAELHLLLVFDSANLHHKAPAIADLGGGRQRVLAVNLDLMSNNVTNARKVKRMVKADSLTCCWSFTGRLP